MSYLLHVCLLAYRGVQHLLFYIFFFIFFVFSMLSVSLDCPFLIAPSVFSNVYFIMSFFVIFPGINGVAIMIVKHRNDRRRQRLNVYYKNISCISKTCLLFASSWVHPRYLLWVRVAHIICVVLCLI